MAAARPERELKESTLYQVEEEVMFVDENIHEAALQNIITGASTNVNEPINVPDESTDEIASKHSLRISN